MANTLAQIEQIRAALGEDKCPAPYCIVKLEDGQHEGPHRLS